MDESRRVSGHLGELDVKSTSSILLVGELTVNPSLNGYVPGQIGWVLH